MKNKILSNPLVEKLIEMSEAELTLKVINPLLKVIKYSKVEYSGGVYEAGKDIICWGENEWKQTFLAVAQVKKFPITAVASDNRSFLEVVRQLLQCCKKEVPNVDDGKKYRPSKIYFITPYSIKTSALNTLFEEYQDLKEKQVHIIDGDMLAKQVEEQMPDLYEEIIGKNKLGVNGTLKLLDNKELLKALKFYSDIDISKIYSDLDFCLGSVSSTKFASYTFSTGKTNFTIQNNSYWITLKNNIQILSDYFQKNILSDEFEEIEKEYNKVTKLNDSIKKKIESNKLKIKEFTSQWDENHKETSALIYKIKSFLDEKKLEGGTDFDNFDKFINGSMLNEQRATDTTEKAYQKQAVEYDESVQYFENKFFGGSTYQDFLKQGEKLLKDKEKCQDKINELSEGVRIQQYDISFRSDKLIDSLMEKQEWLKANIKQFNVNEPKRKHLTDFLDECLKLFKVVELMFSDQVLGQVISFEGKSYETETVEGEDDRFSLSVHSIFNTRKNIILLGNAGAGKTTSLQMYYKYKLEQTDDEVFYLPLAKVLSSTTEKSDSNTPPVQLLQKAIVKFCNSFGRQISELEFENHLAKKDSLFMFDGVDEVIGTHAWITQAVHEFGDRFRKSQIIISSRFGGNYFKLLPYLSIQLLPFTDTQRERFINVWFEGNQEIDSNKLLDHIKENFEIGEIVRTPLLTTVLCVIAQFKIPLPDSEVTLYEERMNLLLGHYDTYKGINRIKTSVKTLESVARRLAYEFHTRGIRHLSLEKLIDKSTSLFAGRISKHEIVKAVNELIDPCNVIVSMTYEGELGFAHLRYQEYLAAKEIITNRGITTDIIRKYLHIPSWRGALVLFSKMTDDIEFLINEIVYKENISSVYDTIEAMLEIRPAKERESLGEIIEKHLELDRQEHYIRDDL